MKILSYLLVAGLGLGTARAQTTVSIGPRLGGNLATITYAAPFGLGFSSKSYPAPDLLAGFQAGIGASISRSHWAWQPALVFSQKGASQHLDLNAYDAAGNFIEYLTIRTRVNYLELPLNVAYGFGKAGQGLQLLAGPYVAVGVGGHVGGMATIAASTSAGSQHDERLESTPLTFGNALPTYAGNSATVVYAPQRRRFDVGFTLGLGYRRGPVQAQLSYGLGLRDMTPEFGGQANYERTAQLTATYYWPGGRR